MTETNESNQNLADSYVFVGSVYLLSNFPAFEKKNLQSPIELSEKKPRALWRIRGLFLSVRLVPTVTVHGYVPGVN